MFASVYRSLAPSSFRWVALLLLLLPDLLLYVVSDLLCRWDSLVSLIQWQDLLKVTGRCLASLLRAFLLQHSTDVLDEVIQTKKEARWGHVRAASTR